MQAAVPEIHPKNVVQPKLWDAHWYVMYKSFGPSVQGFSFWFLHVVCRGTI